MNLFEVDKNIWSHPNKPYIYHIENIANSFNNDKAHKISANFHDIGKLSNEFQRYIRKETKEKTTHSIEGGYLFCFLTESIDKNFLSIFFSIAKHHGSLPNIKDDIYRYSNSNEHDFEKEHWSEKLAVIENNLNIDSKHDANEFYKLMRMFVDHFENFSTLEQFFLFKKRYSRLILADKFEAVFSKFYKNLPILPTELIQKNIDKIHNIIEQKQKNAPNEFRTKAREAIFENFEIEKDSHIYLIKAPTGVGKTFIALELALKIAQKNAKKRRIITTIPFTSIIDQTHSIYEEIIGDGKVLKYHHLTKQNDDDEKEQFSQKVFLSDIWHEYFIVTTFNQLLNAFLSNKNKDNLRLETLRDSVIIIDEVQNIPRTLLKDISFVFDEFAKRYNIHFIIMSATMPQIQDMFEKTMLLSEEFFYADKKSRYELIYQAGIRDYKSLKDLIINQKDSVLCVVNTIEKAKKLHKAIDLKECYLLTTHQIPKHRSEIIQEIKDRLKNNKKTILIATQLIEAGVDLDFDVGFREFAPFGSIIQMAGRVNREGEKDISKVIIFDYIDDKKAPYERIDLQEEKIKKLLEKSIKESDLLKNLDNYFIDVKNQTNSINLKENMKNLEFRTLFDKFNESFMPNQPWKVSLFVEQKNGHFDKFIEDRKKIFDEYTNKFDAISKVKNLEKDLAFYTISVNQKLINKLIGLKHPIEEKFGRYILPYGSKYYSKEKGFNMELTIIEESFS